MGYITWQNRQTHVVNATLFLAQLLLNFLWTIIFFNGSLFTIGVIIILVMDIVVALLIKRSLPISQTAAWLLVPYLAWLLFATYLATGVALLNH